MKKSEENIDKFVKEHNLILLEIEHIKDSKYWLYLECKMCGTKFKRPYPRIRTKLNFNCEPCMKKFRSEKILQKNYIAFKEYVKENSNAKFLSKEFKGWDIVHSFECECGNSFTTRPNDFKTQNKRTCRECSNKRLSEKLSFSIEYVSNWIKDNTLSELISDEYTNNTTPLTLKCNCGNEYTTDMMKLSMGCSVQCPTCTNKTRADKFRFTYKDVKQWIEENTGNKLLSTTYNNNAEKLKLLCECNNEYETTLSALKSGRSQVCSKCSRKAAAEGQALDYEDVKKWIEENTTLKLLSTEYKNYSSKLHVLCECGNDYYPTFASLKKGQAQKCRVCNNVISYAEVDTEKILKENYIKYIPQYTFKQCKYIALLPFDFYLPEANIAIEIDGQQHYMPVQFGNSWERALEDFETRKIKDKIKTDYCQENNIKLIRVPYWNFDKIVNILKENDIV